MDGELKSVGFGVGHERGALDRVRWGRVQSEVDFDGAPKAGRREHSAGAGDGVDEGAFLHGGIRVEERRSSSSFIQFRNCLATLQIVLYLLMAGEECGLR